MPYKQISYRCPGLSHHHEDKDENHDSDDDLSSTFILNVDEDAYRQLLKGHPEDLSIRHDQFQILKFQSDGTLAPATQADCFKAFERRDEFYLAYLIAQKGHLEGTFPKPNELHNELFA